MKMPGLGVGTFRLKDEVARDSVRMGLALGYRHIDTAQFYANEAAVGRAIRDSGVPREQIFLTTKVWIDRLGRDQVGPSLEESLRQLGTDYVDLALIHWPSPNGAVPLAETMEALLEARERGLTRAIGVSNFNVALLDAAIACAGKGQIASQQIEVHPFLQNRIVRDFCAQHAIPVVAYMPLAYGKVMQEPVLQAIAARHATTPALVSLAWVLQSGMCTIPSSTRSEHLAANLGAEKLVLSTEEMQQIATLDRNERIANPGFSPRWD